jgi:lipopolysaccharide exporter
MASLTQRTASGVAWMTAQALVGQALLFGVLIVLGWLLVQNDYTQAALAFTVVTVMALVQAAGVMQVLIQRAGALRAWATPAFWLSLALGVCVGGIVAGSAPIVAHVYQRPELVGLLLVCALSSPINALCTVPDAKLRADLRFKALALTLLLALIVQGAGALALAWGGAGAYALVVPPVIGAVVRCGALWSLARVRVTRRAQARRWRFLLGSSVRLFVGQLAMAVTYQGAPLMLGLLHPLSVFPGVFYLAWNLSDQAMRVLVNNLQQVLFPALRQIEGDERRRADAFLRATRLLMFLGVPACAGLAITAPDLLSIIWRGRWDDAAPIVSALSLGMISRLLFGPSEAMLNAQRRNTTLMTLCVGYMVVYLSAVAYGAHTGETLGAAVATAATMGAMAPLALWLALRPAGYGWRKVAHVCARPLLCAAVASAPAWFGARAMPATLPGHLGAVAITGACFVTVYPLAFRLLAPQDWHELVARVRAILPTRLGGKR